MIPTSRRRSLLLPAILAAAIGSVLWLWLLTRAGSNPASETAGIESEPTVEAPAGLAGGAAERVDTAPPPAREVPGREPPPEPASGPHALLCLRARTLTPLPGIRLWVGDRGVAGPSGEDGVLSIDGELPAPIVTAWGEGFVPLELRRDALPELARLEPADGALEVELVNRAAQERVKRFELHPHLPAEAQEGPWKPTLEQLDGDLYRAQQLPPGEYDVYFWVSSGRSAPRTLAARSVKVEPGRRTSVRLDVEEAVAADSEKD